MVENDLKNFTTIRISRKNLGKLDKLGKRRESYDEIIGRLLDKK